MALAPRRRRRGGHQPSPALLVLEGLPLPSLPASCLTQGLGARLSLSHLQEGPCVSHLRSHVRPKLSALFSL